MLIQFDALSEVTIPHLNQGDGAVSAKMFLEAGHKIMLSRLPAGASIGMHPHPTSGEINYVLQGEGLAVCDGAEEKLRPGDCHYCPQGSAHGIRNAGAEDLLLFTVVDER